MIMHPYTPITPKILSEIKKAVGLGAVVQDSEKLREFGKDAGEDTRLPELVVEATSPRQIKRVVASGKQIFLPRHTAGTGHRSGRGICSAVWRCPALVREDEPHSFHRKG